MGALNGVVECKVCGSKTLGSPPVRPVSLAYDRHHSSPASRFRALNVLLVVGDCTLIGLQPILVYMSKVDGKFLFNPVSVNFLTELAKVAFAMCMLLFAVRKQRPGEKSLLSPVVVLQAARANSLLAMPAFLYAINNYLKFIMQLYFNPATVKMLSNLKVLMIALLLRVVMKRRFTIMQTASTPITHMMMSNRYVVFSRLHSLALTMYCRHTYTYGLVHVTDSYEEFYYVTVKYQSQSGQPCVWNWVVYNGFYISFLNFASVVSQWEALGLLLIGISVNQLHTTPSGATVIAPLATIAYIYTLIFVTVPSLASVYNEYALKSQFETSVHLQNLFLYGYGAFFNLCGIMIMIVYNGSSGFNLLEGHSKATMLLIINNAAQGILSSFFFKYADTILKKYSSTVATIFTGLASAALFGHTLTINFVLGVSIVFISMHQFFSSLPKTPKEGHHSSEEAEEFTAKLRSKEQSFVNMAAGATEDASHKIGILSEREPLLPT